MSANGRMVVKQLSTKQLGNLATTVAQLNLKLQGLRQAQSEVSLVRQTLNSFMDGLDLVWSETMVIDYEQCAITDLVKEVEDAPKEPEPEALG